MAETTKKVWTVAEAENHIAEAVEYFKGNDEIMKLSSLADKAIALKNTESGTARKLKRIQSLIRTTNFIIKGNKKAGIPSSGIIEKLLQEYKAEEVRLQPIEKIRLEVRKANEDKKKAKKK